MDITDKLAKLNTIRGDGMNKSANKFLQFLSNPQNQSIAKRLFVDGAGKIPGRTNKVKKFNKVAPWSDAGQGAVGAALGNKFMAPATANAFGQRPLDATGTPIAGDLPVTATDRLLGMSTGIFAMNPRLRKMMITHPMAFLGKATLTPTALFASHQGKATVDFMRNMKSDAVKMMHRQESAGNQFAKKIDDVIGKVDDLEAKVDPAIDKAISLQPAMAGASGGVLGAGVGNILGGMYASDDPNEEKKRDKERRVRSLTTMLGGGLGALGGYHLGKPNSPTV